MSNTVDRNEAGDIISEGELDAFAVRVGDCFNDSQEILDAENTIIQEVPGLPCSEPHDNEVYAVFDLSLETFPGNDSMSDLAMEECQKQFESFVGNSYGGSILDILVMSPTQESWSRMGDREVTCSIFYMDGEKLTGSIKNSGI